MTDETPQRARVRQLIEALFERPPENRASFLQQVCGDDTELRASVEKVLNDAERHLDESGISVGGTLDIEIDDLLRNIDLKDVGLSRKVGIDFAVGSSIDGESEKTPRERALERLVRRRADVNAHREAARKRALQSPTTSTLDRRIAQAPLSLSSRLQLAIDIAEALHDLHRAGVIHQNLAPSNILVTGTGVRLLNAGAPVSTPRYMTPEQAVSRRAGSTAIGPVVDERTDLFAFGVVLYEMFTGLAPFTGNSPENVLDAVLNHEPRAMAMSGLLPLAPVALDRIVQKCLAKNRSQRWQTARDLADALRWVATDVSLASIEKTDFGQPSAHVGTGSAHSATDVLSKRWSTSGRPAARLATRPGAAARQRLAASSRPAAREAIRPAVVARRIVSGLLLVLVAGIFYLWQTTGERATAPTHATIAAEVSPNPSTSSPCGIDCDPRFAARDLTVIPSRRINGVPRRRVTAGLVIQESAGIGGTIDSIETTSPQRFSWDSTLILNLRGTNRVAPNGTLLFPLALTFGDADDPNAIRQFVTPVVVKFTDDHGNRLTTQAVWSVN
jgi:hypothetical protein